MIVVSRFFAWAFSLLLFVSISGHNLFAAMNENEHGVLAHLQEICNDITTLSCEFTQTTNIPLFLEPVVSKGRLLFKKPDRLVWEYSSPVPGGIVLDGNSGFRWEDKRDKRVSFITNLDPVAGFITKQMLSWLHFDRSWIDSEYDIHVEKNSPLTLMLTPRKTEVQSALQNLRIAFFANGVAQFVSLMEKNGGITTIHFTNVLVNHAIDDREFR